MRHFSFVAVGECAKLWDFMNYLNIGAKDLLSYLSLRSPITDARLMSQIPGMVPRSCGNLWVSMTHIKPHK